MRLLMSLQLTDPSTGRLSWSCLLFFGLGLLSRINAMTLTALALGACSVASAIFLILELSQIAPAASSAREGDVGEKGLLLCECPHAV
jgi:uncharacterized membrane protein